MRTRCFNKIISLLLVLTFILSFNCIPLNTAFAEETQTTKSQTSETPVNQSTVKTDDQSTNTDSSNAKNISDSTNTAIKSDKILKAVGVNYISADELKKYKKIPQDTEQYIVKKDNVDGTKKATFYGAPVRYKNEDGKWADIDNTIVKASDSDNKYTTRSNQFKITFSADLNQNKAVEVGFDNYSVGFKPINLVKKDGIAKTKANFIENNTESEENIKKDDVSKLDATFNKDKEYKSIKYTDSFNDDTSIQVTPKYNGVKEDIILGSVPDTNEFSFELTTGNLIPYIQEDGAVDFINKADNMWVASIPAPYMYDSSNGDTCNYNIKVSLVKESEGQYLYTLTPDKDYLQSLKTVYPVTIDPSVFFRLDKASDTYITTAARSTNFDGNDYLRVGVDSDSYIYRSFFKAYNVIDNLGDSQNNKVISAIFSAYQEYSGSSAPTIGVYPVTEQYDNGAITWKDPPSVSGTAADTNTVSSVDWYDWDVTSLVSSWYTSTTAADTDDGGICIRNTSESSNKFKRFASESYNDGDDPPRLTVYYATPPAISVSSTYTKTSPTVTWSNLSPVITDKNGDGTANDGISFVVQYKTNTNQTTYATISGSNVTTGTYAIPISALAQGANQIYLRAYYSNGRVSPESSVTCYYDTTAPTATFSSPSAGATVNGTVSISGATSDNIELNNWTLAYGSGSSPSSYTTINSGTSSVANGGTLGGWATASLAEGTYTLKLSATDKAGNSNSTTRQVTVDHSAPQAAMVTPTANAFIKGSFNITGTLIDAHLANWYLKYGAGTSPSTYTQINTGTSSISSNSTLGTLNTTGISDGVYTLWLKATDTVGLYGEIIRQVTVDNTSPNAAISVPSVDAKVNGTISISGTASDTNINNWTLDYGQGSSPATWTTINTGTSSVTAGTLGSWNTSTLTDATAYTIRLRVWDKAGNETDTTTSVMKDSTKPTVSISSPLNNINTADNVTITGSVNDANITNWVLEYGTGENPTAYSEISSGESNVTSDTLGTWDISALEDGKYTIRLTANDAAGNTEKTSIQITYDHSGPSTPIVSTTPDTTASWANDTTPVIGWSGLSDEFCGLNKAQYKINDGEWTDIPNSTASAGTLEVPALTSSGVYTISVRGVDNLGNVGTIGSTTYQLDIDNPDAPDDIDASITNGALNSGDSASIKVSVSDANDNPDTNSSGIKEYEIQKSINGGTYEALTTTSEDSYTISNQPDNTSYLFRVRSWDNAGNSSGWTYLDSAVVTSDRTGPSQPASVSISSTDWTNNTKPTITWAGIADGEGNLLNAQYKINDGDWIDIDDLTNGKESGSADINFSSYNDGEYTIYVRGIDNKGNTGAAQSVLYKKDTAAPTTLSITCPKQSQFISNLLDIKGTVDDNRLSSWILDYGIGTNPQENEYTTISFGNNAIATEGVLYSWNASALTANETYTLRLRVTDSAGNTSTLKRQFKKGLDPDSVIEPTLQIDNPGYIAGTQNTIFNYQKINNGGNTALTGSLYIDGINKGIESTSGEGFSVDMTPFTEGSSHKYFIEAKDASGNTYYSCDTQTDIPLNDTLANTDNLDTVNNVEVANGLIKLTDDNGYATSGYFITKAIPVYSETFRLKIDSVQTIPASTAIAYKYSTDNGNTWNDVPADGVILNGVTEIKIKGILTSQDTASTPSVDTLKATALYFIDQQPLSVFLVDPPESLSTLSNVDHSMLLRWNGSTSTGVTYNVYRSDLETGTYTALATGLTDSYYYDSNLSYGQTFYYKVTANTTIASASRESVATNLAYGTMAEENEADKGIGDKPYWTSIGFDTNSGSGKVNIVSGNLYYQSGISATSIALGTTYNSQATYKTALGYGWDYDYNINLFKEYTNGSEHAVVLKLGDGTLHRFIKNSDGTYASPIATYMSLTYDSSTGKYNITTKDKTIYQFNANMKIESITDRLGNATTMTYDTTRGNLSKVVNAVGDELDFSYTHAVEDSEIDKLLSVTDNNGITEYFTYDTVSGKLAQIHLWMDSGMTDKYGEIYSYDTNGKLNKVTNPAARETQIAYTNGKVTAITNPLNEVSSIVYNSSSTSSTVRNATTKYDYNSSGLVTKLTDALGYYTEYGHDQNYNINEVTYLNRVGSTDDVEITTSSEYDNNGNLIYTVAPYEYNDDGTIKYTAEAYKTYYADSEHPYTSFGQPTITKTPFKYDGSLEYSVTTYNYDTTNGNLLSTTDPVGNTTAFTYNSLGDVLTSTETINGLNRTTTNIYDAKGQLTSTRDPDGNTIQKSYDVYGNINSETDAKGAVTYYSYDKLGQNIKTVSPGENYMVNGDVYTQDDVTKVNIYDKLGSIIKSTVTSCDNNEPKKDITRYTYDALERELSTTTAYGTSDQQTVSTNYGTADSSGNYTVANIDGEGVETFSKYNANSWLTKVTTGNTYTETTYDKRGNIIRTVSNNGIVVVTQYDKRGRTIKTIKDPGDSAHKNITCEYYYDLAYRTVSTDAEGIETVTTLDKAGRTINIKKTDSSTDPDTVIDIDYAYDGVYEGKLTSTVTDALGHVKKYYYTKNGLLAKEVDQGDISNGNNTEMAISYEYDPNGNMTSKTAADGTTTNYIYDAENQLLKTQYSTDFYIEYTYDGNGNNTGMKQTEDGITTTKNWEYDNQNRITSVSLNNNTIVKYVYNDNDQVIKMKYPQANGDYKFYGYNYNANGDITSVTDTTDEENPRIIREYNYNNNGILTSLKDYRKFDQSDDDGDYTLQEFGYDTAGRLDTDKYSDVDLTNGIVASTREKEDYDLTLNDNGDVKAETIKTYYTGPEIDINKSYNYDAFGRLLQETVGSATTSYTYDKVGNRISKTSSGGTLYYKYNEFNQLEKISSDSQFANVIKYFSYDARGNQTTQAEGTNLKIYNYDLADRLKSVSQTNILNDRSVMLASYWYDGDGQRSKKVEGSNTTRYYYDAGNLLYTDNGKAQRLEENIIENDGSQIASRRFTENYSGNTYWYRQDIQGSITNIVNKDGNLIADFTYDAYGNTIQNGDADFINSKAYTGAVFDETTNLYYMNARYYNPETGSFLTQDTYRGNSDNPWPWQLYGYCDEDPVNNTDATGHYGAYNDPVCGLIEYDTLKGDYNQDYNISNYISINKYGGGGENRCEYNSNLNPEFLRRMAYLVYYYRYVFDGKVALRSRNGKTEYCSAKQKDKLKLNITMGYRTYEEQREHINPSVPWSFHMFGLAADTYGTGDTRDWFLYLANKDLKKFGLVKNAKKPKSESWSYRNPLNKKEGIEEWHVEPIEILKCGGGSAREEWAMKNAFYMGITIGFPANTIKKYKSLIEKYKKSIY